MGREELYLQELEWLLRKVRSLEVILQNININIDKLQPEEEDEDMEFYLCQMMAEYVQTRIGGAAKKNQ